MIKYSLSRGIEPRLIGICLLVTADYSKPLNYESILWCGFLYYLPPTQYKLYDFFILFYLTSASLVENSFFWAFSTTWRL